MCLDHEDQNISRETELLPENLPSILKLLKKITTVSFEKCVVGGGQDSVPDATSFIILHVFSRQKIPLRRLI